MRVIPVIAPQKIIAPHFGILTNEPTNLGKLTKCQYLLPFLNEKHTIKLTSP